MGFSRIAEETLPFLSYLANKRRQVRRSESDDILNNAAFANYCALSVAELRDRLSEEHARASAMDDKTVKLALSLSVGLSVLGSIAALLVQAISSTTIRVALVIIIGLGILYLMAAGFMALGALRTTRTYGYGTQFLLQQNRDTQTVLADALARQETINIIRHLRNDAAYQGLRNGMFLLFIALLMFAASLAYQSFCNLG